MTGHPDWIGTPESHGMNFMVLPGTTRTIGPNSSQTFTVFPNRPGYALGIWASITSAAATVPWYQVEFMWRDLSSVTILDIQHYYLPATSSGIYRTTGKGPCRGQALQVTITNFDPAFSMTFAYSLAETTQHIARDDWRTVDLSTAVVPGFGAVNEFPNGVAFGDLAAGTVANQNNDTLPAHTTWTQLLPMYTGLVFWQFNANSAITVAVRVPTALGSTPAIDGDSPIWFDTALTDVTVQLAHPRFPLYLDFTNTTAASIGMGWFGVMVENAS